MELFDFGIPALDKALNLTATVLLLLALGVLLIRVILRLCDRVFDRSERLAPFRTYLRSTLRAVLYILLALAIHIISPYRQALSSPLSFARCPF